MRTFTTYGIGVVFAFAIVSGVVWLLAKSGLHNLNVFSVGYIG
jgi:hypothetical protein